MEKLFFAFRHLLLVLWFVFALDSWPGKVKKLVWNRGVKLQWNRLWVREDEFHDSLDMDACVLLDMSPKQRDEYINDLVKRRQTAHENDIVRSKERR